jgi:hypothetical protein
VSWLWWNPIASAATAILLAAFAAMFGRLGVLPALLT